MIKKIRNLSGGGSGGTEMFHYENASELNNSNSFSIPLEPGTYTMLATVLASGSSPYPPYNWGINDLSISFGDPTKASLTTISSSAKTYYGTYGTDMYTGGQPNYIAELKVNSATTINFAVTLYSSGTQSIEIFVDLIKY